MKIFIGTYEPQFDQQNRLYIPTKIRNVLLSDGIKEGKIVVLSKALNGRCVDLRMPENFHSNLKFISSLVKGVATSESLQRSITASSFDVELDNNSRITLPNRIVNFLFSHDDKEKKVTIIGMGSYCQIWNTHVYSKEQKQADTNLLVQKYQELKKDA